MSYIEHLKERMNVYDASVTQFEDVKTKSEFIGVCDNIRKTVEGEKLWQDVMKNKKKITEKEFLKNVNIEDVLDPDETWEQFKHDHSDDVINFYKTIDNIYFFQNHGFEFIWRKI
jgi:predicted protein tyrosine phosphatase